MSMVTRRRVQARSEWLCHGGLLVRAQRPRLRRCRGLAVARFRIHRPTTIRITHHQVANHSHSAVRNMSPNPTRSSSPNPALFICLSWIVLSPYCLDASLALKSSLNRRKAISLDDLRDTYHRCPSIRPRGHSGGRDADSQSRSVDRQRGRRTLRISTTNLPCPSPVDCWWQAGRWRCATPSAICWRMPNSELGQEVCTWLTTCSGCCC